MNDPTTPPRTLRELVERPGCEIRISCQLNKGGIRANWQECNLMYDTGPEALERVTASLLALRSVPAAAIRDVKVHFRDVSQWAEVAIEQTRVVQP